VNLPSVGRIVHYTAVRSTGAPVTRAAIVAEVHDAAEGDITICVFDPKVTHHYVRAQRAPSPMPGYWNWPLAWTPSAGPKETT
jgi:hypothetical protein